jgi:hypothetical protein
MNILLLSLLVSHAPMNMGRKSSASFTVTCTVVRPMRAIFSQTGITITENTKKTVVSSKDSSFTYDGGNDIPEPVVIDGTVSF